MASEQNGKIKGLVVHGLVMAKNRFPAKDGRPERFSLDVACPGCKEMIALSVPPEKWGAVQEQSEFLSRASFRTYKGAVYFEALP